ncbi:MAG: 2-succinyl-5-enolpyruvyl-6-hydroxy-3-cyclohexene-1-carboxylic-acid synthase [Bacteroidales bacterium]|nr:2-succinyl-5-enolpyruvyl-6-hydroxy-3-cyclohexene-1-carboxylic-acid synthase [Bacteroidales bacterium]
MEPQKINPKQHISDLVHIFRERGVAGVVMASGSRNAPLIQAFIKSGLQLHSMVDERSAAYYALGLSLGKRKPAVLVCTSGTAVLNFAPAVAEAFNQKTPLIVLTADRPPEIIGQNENQTIHQKDVFGKNCLKSFSLPCEPNTGQQLECSSKIIQDAYRLATSGETGPVHINIPLEEPLYEELPPARNTELIEEELTGWHVDDELFLELESKQILVVCGYGNPKDELSGFINEIHKRGAVVIAEPISNININGAIKQPEQVLRMAESSIDRLKPEIVLYFGGQVVSKCLSSFLKQCEEAKFIHIRNTARVRNPFKNFDRQVECSPEMFFSQLAQSDIGFNSNYQKMWQSPVVQYKESRTYHVKDVEYGDLKSLALLAGKTTRNDIVFLGNSSIVRYFQQFDFESKYIYANRGTSGIDGCISTALGIAQTTNNRLFCVVGDLSFIYDSNAFWVKDIPKNLKVVVINNNGGGIFQLLEGPKKIEGLLEYQDVKHNVDIKKLCEAYGVSHYYMDQKSEFDQIFKIFVNDIRASVLEIDTKNIANSKIYTDYLKKLYQHG